MKFTKVCVEVSVSTVTVLRSLLYFVIARARRLQVYFLQPLLFTHSELLKMYITLPVLDKISSKFGL